MTAAPTRRPRRRVPTGVWLLGWLVATAAVTGGAFAAGVAHAGSTCSAGLCFADLEGLLWAALALPACVVAWVADAVRRSRRRPRLSRPPRRRRSASRPRWARR